MQQLASLPKVSMMEEAGTHMPQMAGPSSEAISRQGLVRLLVPARPLYTTVCTGCLAKGFARPVGTSFQVATSHTPVL